MVQYLVILLDDKSVSYCHYNNSKVENTLIPLETLKEGILYGMKENLSIQFIYPEKEIPKEYIDVINTIDHTNIKPITNAKDADVLVMDSISDVNMEKDKLYVVRISKKGFFNYVDKLSQMLEKINRLNIVLTDVESFSKNDFDVYTKCLKKLADKLESIYAEEKFPQLNLLTDRIILDKMNNCGAGETNITLAPNGKFYVCPAFYLSDDGYDIGNLKDGLNIKNPQLYKLDNAPICSHCEAYQCKRCIWLNYKTTMEVNTPSYEQCIVAHLERNASRNLLFSIRKHGDFLPNKQIKEIDYLDPFETRKEW